MRINIYTNTQKSQFRQVKDGVWQILGIPITVDDEVMNGVLYDKENNAKGLASYRDKPVTLRHPEDDNGNGISAIAGKGLMDHFSGGIIINTYNHNGVNYVDAEFKEKMMLAQDNGEYYVNRLKNGEPIGISTGLWFDGNNESGIAPNGKEYHAKAINQVGDHVAMLPDDEPPAGGAATFIRFNGENNDQTLTVNIDEVLAELDKDVSDIINNMAENEQERGLLARFFAMCRRKLALQSNNGDNSTDDKPVSNSQTKEGDAMRETLIAALAAKGITVNAEITDAELLAKYNEANTPDVAAAVNAAIKPLSEKLEALGGELAANKDKELDALAKQAAPLLGVEEAEAKALGTNALHKVLAKNGVVVGAPNATNHQSPVDTPKDAINMAPWEA